MPRTRCRRIQFAAGNGVEALHCNRSGLVRREPVIHRRRRRRSPTTVTTIADSNLSDKSVVKDLRVRRVFLPSSIPTDFSSSPDSMDKITISDAHVSQSLNGENRDNADVVLGSGEDNNRSPSAGVAAQDSREPSRNKAEQMDSNRVSRIQAGLRPCSKFKTVQCTSSFSYRRLLPFIMEMEKDTSKKHYQSHSIENSSSPSKCSEDSLCADDKEVVLNPSDDEVNDTVAMTLEPPFNFDRRLQVCEAKSEAFFHPFAEQDLFCRRRDSPPIARKDLSLEELSGGVQEFMQLPTKVDKSKIMEPKLDFGIKTKQEASPSKTFQGRQALAPRKSILKRDTRGCIGLCQCLDCASFRVHAKRAFQFSRKQLQDADEVIAGVIKELSHLRSIVENSNLSPTDNSQLNQQEASSVCSRARKIEELAKDHIRRMFHDLNSHCRLPGARVTFAESIEG